MAQKLFILFEHGAGYALFEVKEFDEIALLAPRVERSVGDLSKFNSVIQLAAFCPFKSGTNALDNINSISEGLLHEDLKVFLETSVPKSSKKLKVLLGVADAKIAAAINEELGINCLSSGVVPEIMRGIRRHFHNLVKGLTEQSASKAQLGLGHSYSRAKVKFNVHRVDNMIIQSIALLDQLDKDVNTFSMRIREWYSYHFPELVKIVPDNYMYARVVQLIKNRKEMTPEMAGPLEEIVMDSAKVQAILDAARSSMGMDISPLDLLNIELFASRVTALAEYRKTLAEYLVSRMQTVAPNLAALIGEQVGARLIAHAGSLTNLAKYPASTVQILGAEKALFRALKTRGNTPKYGLIFHSTFIGRAGAKNKGRISRYLANKCSIASRIDCFTDIPTSVIGEHLKQQVEDRLKFYETGEAPAKNLDVMLQALNEAEAVKEKIIKKEKKKKKKERRLLEAEQQQEAEAMEVDTKPKKDKKRKLEESVEDSTMNHTTEHEMEDEPQKKKKKKKARQDSVENVSLNSTVEIEDGTQDEPTKKKKKKHDSMLSESAVSETVDDSSLEKRKKKKKKNKTDVNVENHVEETEGKKKKKKAVKESGD